MTLETMEQDCGAALRKRKGVAPEAQRDTEAEVGAEQRVRPLAGQVGSRTRDADEDRVELAVERDAAKLHAAEQRFGVRDRRRACERGRDRTLERQRAQHVGAQCARQHPKEMSKGRAHDPFERLLLVRVAAQGPAEAGMVQDERCADQRHAANERAFQLEPEAPALRGRGLEE